MGIETGLTIASKVTFITFEWFLTVVCCNMLCYLEFCMAFVFTQMTFVKSFCMCSLVHGYKTLQSERTFYLESK